jgi:hypothetical protein
MIKSGNYLMGIQYGIDRVEFTFSYNATAGDTGNTTQTTTTSAGGGGTSVTEPAL